MNTLIFLLPVALIFAIGIGIGYMVHMHMTTQLMETLNQQFKDIVTIKEKCSTYVDNTGKMAFNDIQNIKDFYHQKLEETTNLYEECKKTLASAETLKEESVKLYDLVKSQINEQILEDEKENSSRN